MAMVNPLNQIALNPNAKDSRWLTLEVCREFQRNKCTRSENECKFAHPPPHVEVQNGRVIACFDSIKGKCQRKDPPCKYLHPPQHLREQLLQNGRNNLIIKSLQIQAIQGTQMMPGIIPLAAPTPAKTLTYQTVLPGQIPYMVGNQSQTSEQVQAINQMQGNILRWTSQGMPTASGWTTQAMSIRNGASGDSPFHELNGRQYFTMAGPQFLSAAPTSVMQFQSPYNIQTMAIPGGADGTMVTQQLAGVIPTPIPNKAPQRPDRLEPQVVEVLTKKRPRDPADELVLPMGIGMPPYKRVHMDGSHVGKSGALPVYGHQSIQGNPYAQAATLMQLQQQPYIPMAYSGEVMSAAYPNYLPQVTGHPPTVPRF